MHSIQRALPLLILLASCASSTTESAPAERVSFGFETDSDANAFRTATGDWQVTESAEGSEHGKVVEQRAQNPKPVFNVALFENIERTDVDISLALNSLAGEIDQGGGPIWRASDKDNYYIARYNPLEDNFRVYTVVNGVRTELASADIPATGGWHTLRVTMSGDSIKCYYDGQLSLEVTDGTFQDAGSLGLWTKADAQTQFDDVVIE
jgi:hypothetical protein